MPFRRSGGEVGGGGGGSDVAGARSSMVAREGVQAVQILDSGVALQGALALPSHCSWRVSSCGSVAASADPSSSPSPPTARWTTSIPSRRPSNAR